MMGLEPVLVSHTHSSRCVGFDSIKYIFKAQRKTELNQVRLGDFARSSHHLIFSIPDSGFPSARAGQLATTIRYASDE